MGNLVAKRELSLFAICVWRGSNLFLPMLLSNTLMYFTVGADSRLAEIGTHGVEERLGRGHLVSRFWLFGRLLDQGRYRASLVWYPYSSSCLPCGRLIRQSGLHLLLARQL